MSLKYAAVKAGEGHYVLPKTKEMKVDANAFFSDALYAASEEHLWDQLRNAASYEGVVGAYLMPDAHWGFGVPIGSVIVTDGTVIQAGSGYDISCGVAYMKVDGLTAKGVRSKHNRERWIKEVEKRVALGVGSGRPHLMPKFSARQVEEVMLHGAAPLGVSADQCERLGLPVPGGLNLRAIPRAYERAIPQLGSLGGGNHFVEMQVDEETGEVFVMVHCGSRGFGHQIAEHFFYAGAKLRGLPKNRREDSWLHMDEPLGKEYWAYHNAAANYAVANRHVIMRGIRETLEEVYGATGETYYEISHNLVQEETLVLPDGSTKTGIVHRKGATRAFPAGHPTLVGSKWADTGHPCLIPGSMYDGAAVLFPSVDAHRSACSVNHGSGRLLARGKAKRKLAHKQDRIDEAMRSVQRTFNGVMVEGIVSNTKHTPLDECAEVYKDLDAVVNVLKMTGIAEVDRRLWPVVNIKGVG